MNLPNDLNDFVKELVVAGRFASEEAAFVEGIRLLRSQEKLRSEIDKGIRQLDEGQWLDEETVFDEVSAEIDKIESTGREG